VSAEFFLPCCSLPCTTVFSRSVEFDDRFIISGSYDNCARIWDRATGACRHLLMGHQNRIYSVKYTGKIVLTSSLDATICVWNVETGRRLHVLRGTWLRMPCVLMLLMELHQRLRCRPPVQSLTSRFCLVMMQVTARLLA
jgi:WD40 repeat protein